MQQSLSPEILKKYRFVKRFVGKNRQSDGDIVPHFYILQREGVWIKRIHVLIYLLYDTTDSFVTIYQKHDNPKYSAGAQKSQETEIKELITLPKPIRTEDDLALLLQAICFGDYLM